MKMQLQHALAYLAALCGTLGMAWGAHADWFYDFQTAPPPSFLIASVPGSATFSSSVGGGILQMSDTRLPADGGAVNGFAVERSQRFTDVRVAGTLNPTGTTNNRLVFLARDDFSTLSLYAGGIDFVTGELFIFKNIGGATVETVRSTDAAQGSQPPLTNLAASYFLELDAIGNQLTARVFDVNGGTQLLVVNYTDTGIGGPPIPSGTASVAAISTVGVVDGTFGPVGATAISAWFYDFQTSPPPSFIMGNDVSSSTFSSTVGNGVLRLSDTRLPADGGATRAFAVETSKAFTDVRLTGTLNPTGTTDNILNLLARNDPQAINTYAAGIDFVTGVLRVAKVIGGGAPVEVVSSTDDSQGNQPPLTDLARSYFLQLDVVGNHLTARVFDVEGGTQLLVVDYTDTGVGGLPLETGLAGVSCVTNGGLTTMLDGTFGPVGARPIR